MLLADRTSAPRSRASRLALAALLVGFAVSSADAAVLQVTGMTFVSSRDSVREIVVRSEHAKFHTDTKVAELDGEAVGDREGAAVEAHLGAGSGEVKRERQEQRGEREA